MKVATATMAVIVVGIDVVVLYSGIGGGSGGRIWWWWW